MSTILHGTWLLAFTVALAWVLRMIPTACLGAILVYTGYKLVNVRNIRHLAQYGRIPVMIYAVTMIGIVTTDLLTGVIIGVALSIAKLIYKVSHLDVRVLRNGSRVDIHLQGAATFLNVPKLSSMLESLPEGAEVHIHIEELAYIDHACLDLLAIGRSSTRPADRTCRLSGRAAAALCANRSAPPGGCGGGYLE